MKKRILNSSSLTDSLKIRNLSHSNSCLLFSKVSSTKPLNQINQSTTIINTGVQSSNDSKNQSVFSLLNSNNSYNDSNNNKSLIKKDDHNNINFFIKFKPKRLAKIKENVIPLSSIGSQKLNFEKIFKSSPKNNSLLEKFTKLPSLSFEDNIRTKKLEFRSLFIVKYMKNSENYNKFEKNSKNLRIDKQNIFTDLLYKISNIFNVIKNILFNDYISIFDSTNENIFKENNITNDVHSTEIFKTPIEKLFKKEILIFSDFFSHFNKLLSLILDEISFLKAENFKLLQKSHENELILNSKIKSLNELNDFINRYDIATELTNKKKQEKSIENIEKKCMSEKNILISKIYSLENEIQILTLLLEKNKNYFSKCKDYESEIKLNKKTIEDMKLNFRKEINEKNTSCFLEQYSREQLNEQLEELSEVIDNFRRERSDNKKNNILISKKIYDLQNIIQQKNENIFMYNEELEYYITENDKLKKELENKELMLKNMEKTMSDNLYDSKKTETINEKTNNNIDMKFEEESNIEKDDKGKKIEENKNENEIEINDQLTKKENIQNEKIENEEFINDGKVEVDDVLNGNLDNNDKIADEKRDNYTHIEENDKKINNNDNSKNN